MATITQRTGATATAMLGLGTYRPERVVTNDEICEVLDSSDEWIQTRSGIRTRRYAGPDESLVDMATAAAEEALRASGVSAGEQVEEPASSGDSLSTPGTGAPAGADSACRGAGWV